jgi:hypothetical protein
VNLRNTSKNTEKSKFYKTMKTNSTNKYHKRSQSTKLRLMQRYVYACMFILISLNHKSGTFIISNRVFLFYVSLYL